MTGWLLVNMVGMFVEGVEMFENNKIVVGQRFTPIVEKFNEKMSTEKGFVKSGKATVKKIVDGKVVYEFLLEFSDGDWVSGTKVMPVGEWFDWYKPEEMEVGRKYMTLDSKILNLVKSFDFVIRSVKMACLNSSGDEWDFNYPFEFVVGKFGVVVPEAPSALGMEVGVDGEVTGERLGNVSVDFEPVIGGIMSVDSGLSEEKLLRAGEWLGLSSEINKVIKLAKDLV